MKSWYKYCDICGNSIPTEPTENYTPNYLRTLIVDFEEEKESPIDHFVMCEDCYKSFIHWATTRKVNKKVDPIQDGETPDKTKLKCRVCGKLYTMEHFSKFAEQHATDSLFQMVFLFLAAYHEPVCVCNECIDKELQNTPCCKLSPHWFL